MTLGPSEDIAVQSNAVLRGLLHQKHLQALIPTAKGLAVMDIYRTTGVSKMGKMHNRAQAEFSHLLQRGFLWRAAEQGFLLQTPAQLLAP